MVDVDDSSYSRPKTVVLVWARVAATILSISSDEPGELSQRHSMTTAP